MSGVVVDTVLVDLQVKLAQYMGDMDKAIAKTKEFKAAANDTDTTGGAQQSAARAAKASSESADAAKKASAEIKRAKKEEGEAAKQAAKDTAEAAQLQAAALQRYYAQGPKIFEAKAKEYSALAKAAEESAAKQVAAAKAVAASDADDARFSGLSERAAARAAASVERGTGANFGKASPRGSYSPPVNFGDAENVEKGKEVNQLLIDQAENQALISVAAGKTKNELRDQATYYRLLGTYKRAGLTEEEASVRVEATMLAIEKERAKQNRDIAGSKNSSNKGSVGQFVEGAGLGRTGGSSAAIAGIGVAAAIGGGIAAVQTGLKIAKDLADTSRQLNVTTRDLQVYRAAAQQVGVTNEQLDSSFRQASNNIGRAQLGSKEQGRVFTALGIDLGNAKTGYKSLSDLLPTIADRLSKVTDSTKRTAYEQAIFGETGNKLDGLLSGGTDAINKQAEALEREGRILSDKEIQSADETARKLAQLQDKLEKDLTRVVAGNATAILALASAFSELADQAIKAAGAGLQWLAIQSRMPGQSDAGRKNSTDTLMFTQQGRDYLLRENTSALNELDRVDRLKKSDKAAGYRVTKRDDGTEVLSFNDNPAKGDRSLNTGLSGLYGVSDTEQGRYQAYIRLQAERQRIAAANVASAPPKPVVVQPGKPDPNANPFAQQGKSAEQLAKEAAAREKRYEDQLAQFQEQELRARESMSGDINERATIEKQLIQRQLDRQLTDIDLEVKTKQIDASKADELKAAATNVANEQKRAVETERLANLAQAQAAHQQTALDIESDLLNSRLALATTSKERLDIELKLLANQKEQERNQLTAQLASTKANDPARSDIEKRIGSLDDRYDAKAQGARQSNLSPIQSYLKEIPKTADEINEKFEQIAVDGVGKVNDQLSAQFTQLLGIKGVLGEVVQEFIKLALQKYVFGAIFGSITGGGGGGFLSSLFGGGRAGGGPVEAGTVYKVNEHGTEGYASFAQPGRVIPLGEMKTGGGTSNQTNVSVAVDARQATDPQAVRRAAYEAVYQTAPVVVAAAQGQTLNTIKTPKLPGSG